MFVLCCFTLLSRIVAKICLCCRLHCDSIFWMIIKAFDSASLLTGVCCLPHLLLKPQITHSSAINSYWSCVTRIWWSLIFKSKDKPKFVISCYWRGSRVCPNFDIFLITKCYLLSFAGGKTGPIERRSFCKWMISCRWVWRFYWNFSNSL